VRAPSPPPPPPPPPRPRRRCAAAPAGRRRHTHAPSPVTPALPPPRAQAGVHAWAAQLLRRARRAAHRGRGAVTESLCMHLPRHGDSITVCDNRCSRGWGAPARCGPRSSRPAWTSTSSSPPRASLPVTRSPLCDLTPPAPAPPRPPIAVCARRKDDAARSARGLAVGARRAGSGGDRWTDPTRGACPLPYLTARCGRLLSRRACTCLGTATQ
jgi:hypothetical protein